MGASRDDGRFLKQVRFAPLGAEGQGRLERARVVLVGCGALGGSLAQNLVRAGVGQVVLVDRDVVEPSNLPRQVLFDERHALERCPKVDAARETLTRIGGPSRLETHAVHLSAANVRELLLGADLVLDGTDNLATRYLVNDWCVENRVPWIYGGVVGGGGLVLAVRPGEGPCLRCLFPEPAPPGSLETCDTAGVILPAVAAVAALQAGLALRLLGADPSRGPGDGEVSRLLEIDAWSGSVRQLEIARDPECEACAKGFFEFLDAGEETEPVVLCGRQSVQLPPSGRVDLAALETRLGGIGARVRRAGSALRIDSEGLDGESIELTVFADGRALVEGTEDPARAQALFDRLVGR